MKTYDMDSKEKKRIFDIALSIMNDVGYESLTVRQICKQAGISTGKFYYYFDSKQQLLAYFYNNLVSEYKDEVYDSLQGMDVRTQIIRFYVWYNDYLASFGLEFVRSFFSNMNPVLNTHVYNNEIVAITDDLLATAIQNGFTLPQGRTIREISDDFCVIIKGIVFDWCLRHGDFDIGEYTEDLLTRVMAGILPEQ